MKRFCYVTADSDPNGEWMGVEAASVFHAATYYCGAGAARPGGPPRPGRHSIITVRVDGREYRVREQRVWEGAGVGQRQSRAGRRAASEMCPYWGKVNLSPGFLRMQAYTCRECGRAVQNQRLTRRQLHQVSSLSRERLRYGSDRNVRRDHGLGM